MYPIARTLALGFGFILIGVGGMAQADNRLPGKPLPYFAANCANCHGTNGKANNGIPALAGQNRELLEALLLSHKSGAKQSTIMYQLIKGYTDEEIALLADFFSKQSK